MTLLAQLLSVIRPGDSITLTLKRMSDNVEVIVQPVIAKADDPDPQLAGLRTLLITPFYFTVANGGDVDAAWDQHVTAKTDSRIAVISAEDHYLAAVNAAVESSRKAASEKAAKPGKASGGKKAPVVVTEAGESDGADDSPGDDDAVPAPAATSTPPVASAAPAGAAPSLLSDLDL
ncbi:hypothetical protein [Metallibacterium scheffleri]|uniref:PRTRC system protein E n=1 Tax=Metallibacterium scheffleri TaxID=993689 RepID=A0A4S3KMI1_9GAMM|nr:hypothetical protein [Metallibacterium scheffleri]THD10113.1 hypothetical protein B1806_09595 [Metallibacterium scheffleri]